MTEEKWKAMTPQQQAVWLRELRRLTKAVAG